MSNESLRIPKHLVEVEIKDARGVERSASVYLASASANGGRPERLQDVLRERRFLPLRENGSFCFISREHIDWLKMDVIAAIDEFDPEAEGNAGSVSAGVKLELEDGTLLLGGIRYLLPKPARRVGDYLEGLERFFPLRTPDYLYLINRDRIVQVIPIDEVRR